MCGIAGIYTISRPVDRRTLDRFTDSLAHRGPDGQGIHIDVNLGLGHRRLAILDLSDAGACPMQYEAPDGRSFRITFNGEVYNFLELRRSLEELGHRFRSNTDTEVVVAAYAQWGEECLFRFNGMWAMAIWEVDSRTLFLSRDRFGIKPLYYTVGHGRFAFASEMKAFLELDGFVPRLNEQMARFILQNSYAAEGTTDETLMSGVKKLPGGHSLTVDASGQLRIRRWWETAEHLPAMPGTYEDQVAMFREIFLDAVRIRMRSDVPVGTCLSGGVDSSGVASAMFWLQQNTSGAVERCPSDWQQAFVATFPGTAIDERVFAEEVVRHTQAKAHYWVFEQESSVRHLLDSVWSMEDVYGGLAVPVWCLYRVLRQAGVYVSLDGHGGDELLGGYGWYLDWPMSQVNRNLYNDFHYSLLPAILRNYDRCSMAHGIEVRMPIMDWRLVTLAFSLPAESKIGGGFTKRVFRDALKGIMPENIRRRSSKIGFNSPMIEWFNGGMAKLINMVTRHPLWQESPFWDGKLIGQQLRDKTNARAWTQADWGSTLHAWTLMNIVIWQLLFIERENLSRSQP